MEAEQKEWPLDYWVLSETNFQLSVRGKDAEPPTTPNL